MNKSDLKSGMRVTMRNGRQFIYFSNPASTNYELVEIAGGYMPLADYNDDLICVNNCGANHDWDIVKAEVAKNYLSFLFCSPEDVKWETIWERQEPKQYNFTEAENLVRKAYALKGYPWIAKDKSGGVCAFKTKPIKGKCSWWAEKINYDGGYFVKLFDFNTLSWDDTEPCEYKGEF